MQASFDALKSILIRASLMYSRNYQNGYFLYRTTLDTTNGMILVQEGDGIEHSICYLSHNLNDTKVKYSYVEKLALDAVQVIHIFCHYILLQKTIVISDCNPMTYILSCQLLGGNTKNASSFCRNFIWNSSNPNQRNL